MTTTIRWGAPADAEALVVLRAAMYRDLGDDPGGPDAPWRADAAAWFARVLAPAGAGDAEAVVVLADVAGTGPVSCVLALLQRRAPSPTNRGGLVAHVSQVSTLPEHRRRGHARACLVALLARFDEQGVERADLHASGDGEALYRSLGFVDSPYPSLRRSRPVAAG